MQNSMRLRIAIRRSLLPGLAITTCVAICSAYAADAPPPSAEPALDPKALDALKSMGTHLRELKSFSVHADTTIDEVTDEGEKLQFGGTVDFRVRRPDRLRADIDSDRRNRTYYYDGKTLTQYSPRMGYYASVSAPPTLGDLAQALKNKYGISLPLTDLFRWGVDEDSGSGLTGAAVIGPATIGSVQCDHYAFRQSDVDWQVWIAHESQLPCKLVITTTEEPTRPQYTAQFKWDPKAKFDDKTFVFDKPKAAHKIEFAVVDASAQ